LADEKKPQPPMQKLMVVVAGVQWEVKAWFGPNNSTKYLTLKFLALLFFFFTP
jgi:hypothetical protein